MERFGVGALSHRNRLSGSSLPMSGWKVSLMERYFLHVTTVSNGIIKDDEGAILANLQAARDEALESAETSSPMRSRREGTWMWQPSSSRISSAKNCIACL